MAWSRMKAASWFTSFGGLLERLGMPIRYTQGGDFQAADLGGFGFKLMHYPRVREAAGSEPGALVASLEKRGLIRLENGKIRYL